MKGKKGYKGTAAAYYLIKGSSTSLTIKDIPEKTYTGSQIRPRLTVQYTNSNGKTATLSPKYYNVIYSNNAAAGTASVTVTGKVNYSGTASTTFLIKAKDIARGIRVNNFKSSILGNGSEVTQNITLSCGKHMMIKDRDYTVTYMDNVNKGKATMTVTGVTGSNFTGKIIKKFNIK